MLSLYINALIYEANPFNEGPKGLRDADKQIAADAKAMLNFVRDTSVRQGEHLLFTMTNQPTINKALGCRAISVISAKRFTRTSQ